MNKGLKRVALAAGMALASLSLPGTASAVTLIVSGGILQGASGVNVEGTLFDVTFRNGTCAALFNGCNEASDFTFTTETSARLAAQALRDQVLIDGPLGQFDTDPSLTAGCSGTGSTGCLFYIPRGVVLNFFGAESLVLAEAAFNDRTIQIPGRPAIDRDRLVSGNYPSDLSTDTTNRNFALFSNARPIAAGVPEPATWAMMLLGFFGVGGAMRQARRKRHGTLSVA